jgi:hypothetical protein
MEKMPQEDLEIEKAVMGSNTQVGPDVAACLKLFNMYVPDGPDGEHKGALRRYKSELCPAVRRPLLASQVTGVAHMLLRTCGEFPLSETQLQDRDKYEKILEQLKGYRGPATGGGFVEDAPGMGKTSTALAFFDWLSKHGKHVDSEGAPCYRPGVLFCPDGHVLRQWAEEINSSFPEINLIVSKPGVGWKKWDSKKYGIRRFEYVERAAIRDPKKHWPVDLDYVFDTKNPKASKTIILGPYTTMRARMINVEEISGQRRRKHGKAPWPQEWCYDKKKRGFRAFHIDPFWKGRISLTMSDEGHQTRNEKTQLHWMLRRLNADTNWYLTATPMVNSATDIASEAKVLWQRAELRLMADPDFAKLEQEILAKMKLKDKAEKWKKNDCRVWEHVAENYPATSDIQLKRLDAKILYELLRSRNLSNIQKYYRYFDQLASIRRSPSSVLPNGDTTLSLVDIMPAKTISTVALKHIKGPSCLSTEDELTEFQIWHRKAARYVHPVALLHITTALQVCKVWVRLLTDLQGTRRRAPRSCKEEEKQRPRPRPRQTRCSGRLDPRCTAFSPSNGPCHGVHQAGQIRLLVEHLVPH